MKSRLWTLVSCTLAMGAFSVPASAAIIVFTTTLTGTQEVPANASTATGSATVTVDDVLNTVAVNLTFSGLTANASAAHIHCCVSPGTNGPVALGFAGFPAATSGSFAFTFTGVSLATINGLKANQGYVNVHNATFPGGEIRGNLVPEPGTLMLLGGSLAVLLFQRRRTIR